MPGSHRQSCKKRRRYVARLYISGLSQFEIAVWLDISQATVSRDLREAGRDASNPHVRRLRQADEAALATSIGSDASYGSSGIRSTRTSSHRESSTIPGPDGQPKRAGSPASPPEIRAFSTGSCAVPNSGR